MSSKRKKKSNGSYRAYRDQVAAHPITQARESKSSFTWDDLAGLSAGIHEKMQTALMTRELVASVDISQHPAAEKIQQTVVCIERDVAAYRERMASIAKLHEGRTGMMKNPDEMFACIDISQRYFELNDSFDQVVLVNVNYVTSQVA